MGSVMLAVLIAWVLITLVIPGVFWALLSGVLSIADRRQRRSSGLRP